jgi:hypothetical protein
MRKSELVPEQPHVPRVALEAVAKNEKVDANSNDVSGQAMNRVNLEHIFKDEWCVMVALLSLRLS